MLSERELGLAQQCYGSQELPKDLLANLNGVKMAWQRVGAGQVPTDTIVLVVGLYGAVATAVRPPSPWDAVELGEDVMVVESNRQGECRATFVGRCNSPDDDLVIVDIFGDPDNRRRVPMWQVCIPGRIKLATQRADGTKVDLPAWTGELEIAGHKVADPEVPEGVPNQPADTVGSRIVFKPGDTVMVSTPNGIIEGVYADTIDAETVEVLVNGVSSPYPACDVALKHTEDD